MFTPATKPLATWLISLLFFTLTLAACGGTSATPEPAIDATPKKTADQELPHCVREVELKEVRGNSMKGLAEQGETIRVLHGYYDCNPVSRGDWLIFSYSGTLGDDLSLIKRAMGLPGDDLSLVDSDQGTEQLIHINNAPVLTHLGEPYKVNKVGASYIRLALSTARQGKIPRGRYLVLGTAQNDGWDSRRLGFISHDKLQGKGLID